ncbi:DNA-3-methyladenine glycosylase family protein [Denitrobaculum tricleocarpae]|uniref:DNA-3-methyladenine glycosylase II n=1 Tax=Denitrobaculum tricleocarpae TaxID=2591009 RepID=A0A545U1R1_9PROT|nr:DNA-3-methyladenine glycosylase [Denitrobaculum tricleocarpae]TQV83419.1 DNA-3-methyladenine glycosylase 2 family protein [Denitrobaculum tricleocarpae]
MSQKETSQDQEAKANVAPADEALRPAMEALAERDRDIAIAYEVCGLPPVRRHEPGFAGLIRIMAAQQVSARAAQAIIGRLDAALQPVTAEGFLALDDETQKQIGLSRPKQRYGRALAEDILSGRIDLQAIASLDDEAAAAALMQAKGIGRWTAEVYLLFALQRPDIWPAGDLAVQVAAQKLKGLSERPVGDVMVALAEDWRPYRTAAARFLWHLYRHPGVPEGGF